MKPSLVLIFVLSAALIEGACTSSTNEALDGGAGDGGLDSAPTIDGASSDAAGDSAACKLVRPYSTKTPACNTCAEQHCCALINTCLNDDSCDNGYVDCILGCALITPSDAGSDADVDAGIASCENACAVQYPTARNEYDAFATCVDSNCKTPCN